MNRDKDIWSLVALPTRLNENQKLSFFFLISYGDHEAILYYLRSNIRAYLPA